MAKTRAKAARSKASRKGSPKPRAKASARPVDAPAAIEPTRPREPAAVARMGRPPRLNGVFIAEFVGHLQLGLPLQHAAALCGALASQVSDWLREGRRDVEAGRRTVAADFSERVRATLAELQKQHLGSLVIYQRIAEGWSPTCQRCTTKGAPCGRHRRNLKLAADLSWKMLTHRFPSDWGASTVRHELASPSDEERPGGPARPAGGDDDGKPPPLVAGLVVFMPKRNDDV